MCFVPLYSELEDESFIRKRIAYATEFCQQFPDTDDAIIEPMLITEAVSHALLGDREKAEPLFRKLVKRFPGSASPYICWGDMYVIVDPPDYDKAEEIYRRGLIQCPEGRNEIYERLKDLKEIT